MRKKSHLFVGSNPTRDSQSADIFCIFEKTSNKQIHCLETSCFTYNVRFNKCNIYNKCNSTFFNIYYHRFTGQWMTYVLFPPPGGGGGGSTIWGF